MDYSREYQHIIGGGGHTEQAHGSACHQHEGSWRVAN